MKSKLVFYRLLSDDVIFDNESKMLRSYKHTIKIPHLSSSLSSNGPSLYQRIKNKVKNKKTTLTSEEQASINDHSVSFRSSFYLKTTKKVWSSLKKVKCHNFEYLLRCFNSIKSSFVTHVKFNELFASSNFCIRFLYARNLNNTGF